MVFIDSLENCCVLKCCSLYKIYDDEAKAAALCLMRRSISSSFLVEYEVQKNYYYIYFL